MESTNPASHGERPVVVFGECGHNVAGALLTGTKLDAPGSPTPHATDDNGSGLAPVPFVVSGTSVL